MKHYDSEGNQVSVSVPEWTGAYKHLDSNGNIIGESGVEVLRTRKTNGDARWPVKMPFDEC